MNRKYLSAGIIGLLFIIGWNVLLIQRDDAMFKEYSRHQAIENIKKPISSEIR